MKTVSLRRPLGAIALLAALGGLIPNLAMACACGCGVFDVGASALLPTGSGGLAFFEYNVMDQTQNHSGVSRAPAANNDDKEIKTNFFTFGGQYMFNHSWGVMLEAPYWSRTFKTLGDDGAVDTFNHSAFGDIRLRGMYTGFSPDMSTGLTFGVKLPTGDWRYANFDRDTEIGTGSTDLLLGGFHRGAVTRDNSVSYFVQVLWDKPVASQGGYTPGAEFDGAIGGYYNGLTFGGGKIKIAPVLQLLASVRARDSGPASDPVDSGYSRGIIAPGVEIATGDWTFYGDVEVPVYQFYVGNQLAAPAAVKLILSRNF